MRARRVQKKGGGGKSLIYIGLLRRTVKSCDIMCVLLCIYRYGTCLVSRGVGEGWGQINLEYSSLTMSNNYEIIYSLNRNTHKLTNPILFRS